MCPQRRTGDRDSDCARRPAATAKRRRPRPARDQPVGLPRVQVLSQLPEDQAEPNLVITPYAVSKYRLRPHIAAWLIQARQPLTAAQINGIRQRAESLSLSIETKNDNPSLSQLDA
jgi:hypothetical protein